MNGNATLHIILLERLNMCHHKQLLRLSSLNFLILKKKDIDGDCFLPRACASERKCNYAPFMPSAPPPHTNVNVLAMALVSVQTDTGGKHEGSTQGESDSFRQSPFNLKFISRNLISTQLLH